MQVNGPNPHQVSIQAAEEAQPASTAPAVQKPQDSHVQAAVAEPLPGTTQSKTPSATIPVPHQSRSSLTTANSEAERVRQSDQARTSFLSKLNIRSWFSRRNEESRPSNSRSSVIGFFKRIFTPSKPEALTANMTLNSQSRSKQNISPHSASSSSSTWQADHHNPNESDSLPKETFNLDASHTLVTKDFFGRITGGIVSSGDGFGRVDDPKRAKAIADVAREGCLFLSHALMKENDPGKLTKERLTAMIPQVDAHLKQWNLAHNGETDPSASTNLAAMRLFKNKDGSSQVAGVNLGNQRLLAIDARSGKIHLLNNPSGQDDSSAKTALGGAPLDSMYDEKHIEPFNIKIPIPEKHVILVALTDGAWQNFEKVSSENGEENPNGIDCDKLQQVLKPDSETLLSSQTVMQKLESHVATRSKLMRQQSYELTGKTKEAYEKMKKLEGSLEPFPNTPQTEDFRKAMQKDLELVDIKKNLQIAIEDGSEKKIARGTMQLEKARSEFNALPLLTRFYIISQRKDSAFWELTLEDMISIKQEMEGIPDYEDHTAYLDRNIQLLQEGLKIKTEWRNLDAKLIQTNKALDDATITAMSPFGPRNMPEKPAASRTPQAAAKEAAKAAAKEAAKAVAKEAAKAAPSQAMQTITRLKDEWNASHQGNLEVIEAWRDPRQAQTQAHVLFDSADMSSPFHLARAMFQSEVPDDFEERLLSALAARKNFTPTERLYMASHAPIPHQAFLAEMQSIEKELQTAVNNGQAEYQSRLEYAQRQVSILEKILEAYSEYRTK